MATHDFGGTGRVVALSHAAGFHGLVWRPVAERLRDVGGFHVVSLDLRGHGDTPAPEGDGFDWQGFGDDILTVVDGLRLAKPLGVGHSAGGAALVLAEEARPGTFSGLLLYEPVVIPVEPPLGRDRTNWLAAQTRRRRFRFASRDEAYRTFAAKGPFDRWAPTALGAYVEHGFEDQPDGTVRLKCRPEDEALTYEMATDHGAFGALARVGCPVLLLAGGEGDFATYDDRMDRLAAAFPDARCRVLAGMGHFGPLEDPEAFAEVVLEWVAALG